MEGIPDTHGNEQIKSDVEKHHSEIFLLSPRLQEALNSFLELPQLGKQVFFWVIGATCVVRQPQRHREAEAAAAVLVKSCHELEDPAANSWLSIVSTAEKVWSTTPAPPSLEGTPPFP